LVNGSEIPVAEIKQRLPFRRFFLFFEDVLDHGEGKKIAILEFSDEADALHIAVVIFRNIPSLFVGLGKESFTDVKMDGFFGNLGIFDQVSYLQEFSDQVFFIEYYYMLYTKVKKNLVAN